MVDWDLIPFAGEKKTRKRLRELDKEFASILVLIGIGFSKIFEGFVAIPLENYPITMWGVDISMIFWWSVYTAFWIIVFLLEVDAAAKEGASNVRQTVEDTMDD